MELGVIALKLKLQVFISKNGRGVLVSVWHYFCTLKLEALSAVGLLGTRWNYKGHSVLTSDREEKHVILPTKLTIVVRRGKLWIYNLQNLYEVF